MRLIFNQVTPRYYTIYNKNGKYLMSLGTIKWDHHEEAWEFFPDDDIWITKEQLNSINSFFQGLEDLNDSTD